jgi:chromosome segregation ATPase
MDPLHLLEWECTPRSVRRREVSGMDEALQAQIARLTSDVQHVQTDVADIKVDLRRVDDKLAAMNGYIAGTDARVYQVEQKLTDKIEGVRTNLTDKIEGLRIDLTDKIEGLRIDLTKEIDALRKDISSMKVWALTLYFAQAGSLLFVMAKGFKWF